MTPELSREAAHALNMLPLRPPERDAFTQVVAQADTRETLPPWAIAYLDEAKKRKKRNYADGQRIRFTADGMVSA